MRPLSRYAALLLALLLASPVGGAQVRIVVLGSSTAAGTGPSQSDSAWVNRYRTYLRGLNSENLLINLARGGYTTYHILPTGTPRTEGRPAVDSERNITTALSVDPDAILINMPSNDAASGFTVAEQLANYDAILEAAGDVPVWISTTQPRNLNADGRANLMAMRDSTLQRYGDHALDFWTGIATEGEPTPGVILPQYDSGDGIHLNDAAHRILFERVRDANVLGLTTATDPRPTGSAFGLTAAPSPFRSSTAVTFRTDQPGPVSLRVYDAIGREVVVLIDGMLPEGPHRAQFEGGGLPGGVYIVRLRHGAQSEARAVVLSR